MRLKSIDLWITILLTLLVIACSLRGYNQSGAAGVAGALLTLVLPGYALVAALFPACSLSTPERLVFSLGLSMTTSILGGLVLNLLPWGLRPLPWTIILGCVTLAASFVAISRRHLREGTGMQSSWPKISLTEALLFAAAAWVALYALSLARAGALRQNTPAFTQFWMLPALPSEQATLRIGVVNLEGAHMEYAIRLEAGDRTLREWSPVVLDSGSTWEILVQFPPGEIVSLPVKAQLYRLDASGQPYRQATWWPDSGEGP